jgi:hypothetical protein
MLYLLKYKGSRSIFLAPSSPGSACCAAIHPTAYLKSSQEHLAATALLLCAEELQARMALLGEGDPRWIVEEREDGKNVNSWHCESGWHCLQCYANALLLMLMCWCVPVICNKHRGGEEYFATGRLSCRPLQTSPQQDKREVATAVEALSCSMQVKQRLEDMFKEVSVESQQGSYRITNCKEVTGDVSNNSLIIIRMGLYEVMLGGDDYIVATLWLHRPKHIAEPGCISMNTVLATHHMDVSCRHTSAQEKATR